MKKLTLLILMLSAALLPAFAQASGGKTLVVYFSRTGNTRALAVMIQEITGADIHEIVPVTLYSATYNETIEQVKKEQAEDYRPPLRSRLDGIDGYDTILLGYPIWWGILPPPVVTFLTQHNLKGKTIVPFCTHGGSGLSRSIADIENRAPGAAVKEGLALRGNQVAGARDEVRGWLRRQGVIN